MKFSIIIPSYKSRYLEEAINSVLSQTYQNWELIIVDDCSPENLKCLVERYLFDSRISYYRNDSNIGQENLVDNWNKCLKYCTGEYVLCMGDDDALLPCCLENYINLIEKYSNLNVYHMRTKIVDDCGKVEKMLEERPEYESAVDMMINQWTKHRQQFIGDFLFSRKWLLDNGGYVKFRLAYCSDWATANKAALEGNGIANCNSFGFLYRDNSLSITRTQNLRDVILTSVYVKRWYYNLINNIDERLTRQAVIFMEKTTDDLVYYLVKTEPTISNIYFCLKEANFIEMNRFKILNLCIRATVKHYIED